MSCRRVKQSRKITRLFHLYTYTQIYVYIMCIFTFTIFTGLIEEGYHSTNPYHNAIHATDVTQAMHCFLQEDKVSIYTYIRRYKKLLQFFLVFFICVSNINITLKTVCTVLDVLTGQLFSIQNTSIWVTAVYSFHF